MLPIINAILPIISKFVPDQNQQLEAAKALEVEYTKQMEMQSKIVLSEKTSGAGRWRPRLMYLCMFFVFAYWTMYDFIPYLRTVFDWKIWIPEAPSSSEELWSFLKLGVGGYISSRGVEKSVALFKNG